MWQKNGLAFFGVVKLSEEGARPIVSLGYASCWEEQENICIKIAPNVAF